MLVNLLRFFLFLLDLISLRHSHNNIVFVQAVTVHQGAAVFETWILLAERLTSCQGEVAATVEVCGFSLVLDLDVFDVLQVVLGEEVSQFLVTPLLQLF